MDSMDTMDEMDVLQPIMGTDAPAFLSAAAAAAALGVSQRTVRRAIARGELHAPKIGGVFRITPQAVSRYRRRLHGSAGQAAVSSDASHPLPLPLTSFVGREQELLEIKQKLASEGARLITLTGPGGVGKTRLALRVAVAARSDEQVDVQFVSLAEVASADLVLPEIARSLGIRYAGNDTPEMLIEHLHGREMLLILDNLEHVVAVAQSIAQLLARCPHLRVLATSRVRLGLLGEHVYPVQPLQCLDLRDQRSSPVNFAAGLPPALALFADRAREASPRFDIDAHNLHVVAEICAHLDGLPLAIELAAARLRVLSPQALLAQLSRRLTILTDGSIDRPTRHQTLRNTIAWSYTLLSPADQMVFRRLSVCQGGFCLDLADAIISSGGGSTGGETSLDVVHRLVDHSLVQSIHNGGDRPRFVMLETIREFGQEQLADHGESEPAHRAHAAWALEFARRNEVAPLRATDEKNVHRLVTEDGNLDAALQWAERHDEKVFVSLVAAVGWLWWVRRYRHLEQEWLERGSTLHGCATVAEHARIMTVLGFVLLVGGKLSRAHQCFIEGLSAYRSLEDAHGIAHMHLGIGVVATYQREYGEAAARFDDALRHARAITDADSAAAVTAAVFRNRSVAARDQGQLRQAEADELRAYELEQKTGSMLGMLTSLAGLGDIARDLGEYATAGSYFLRCLRLGRLLGETRVSASTVEGIATVIVHDDPSSAARLLGAMHHWRQMANVPLQVRADAQACRMARTAALAALGEEGFATAWSAGEGMPLVDAVAEAERHAMLYQAAVDVPQPAASVSTLLSESLPTLTAREVEVLQLVAAGLSDRAIADRLFLSVRTAQNHVARISRKFGVRSREAAVAAARAAGVLHG